MAAVNPEASREELLKAETAAAAFPGADDDDCGVCSGAKSMLRAAFGRYGGKASQPKATAAPVPSVDGGGSSSASSSADNASDSGRSSGGSSSSHGATGSTSTHTTFAHTDSTSSQPPQSSPTFHLLPCPPDGLSLGRSTWTFLHTMAAYYPRSPTPEQQQLMHGMMRGLGEFYPCHICAEHLREQMQIEPPVVTCRVALSDWLCQMHNKVNLVLGKSEFDCKLAQERWKDGPAEGRDCVEEPELPASK